MNQLFFRKLIRSIIAFALAALFIQALFAPMAYAGPQDDEVNTVLLSAESLFKAMKQKNYTAIWQYLSAESKKSTVEMVYKSLRKSKISLDRERVGDDFAAGGELAKAYWDSYLNIFDPDTVLLQSRWEMGDIKKDRATINILYRKSNNPAILLLYREENRWKVGMEETFRPRRWLLP